MKYNRVERIGQWVLLIASLTGALVAAGVSIVISVSFGLKMGVLIAIVFGLADFLKVFMPLSASAQGGMKGWQKAIWGIAVALAVLAASSHLIEMQGERLQHALSANRQVETSRADEDKLRARLASITETMSVAAAKDLVAATAKSLKDAEAVVKSAGIKCDQRKTCVKAADASLAAKKSLADAEARDALQAKLDGIKPAAAAEVEVFGPAKQLSAITGWDEAGTASVVILMISVLCLCLLEAAAAGLAVDAGKRIARMAKTMDKPGKLSVVEAQATDKVGKPEALAKLKLLLFHAPNKEMVAGQRVLAEMLGCPKSSLAEWLGQWEAEGHIVLVKSRKATTVKAKAA